MLPKRGAWCVAFLYSNLRRSRAKQKGEWNEPFAESARAKRPPSTVSGEATAYLVLGEVRARFYERILRCGVSIH